MTKRYLMCGGAGVQGGGEADVGMVLKQAWHTSFLICIKRKYETLIK